jgi:hypothetical protein
MILFHSKEDIGALSAPFFGALTVARLIAAAANRMRPSGPNQLSRFRHSHEPGMLSLPDRTQ